MYSGHFRDFVTAKKRPFSRDIFVTNVTEMSRFSPDLGKNNGAKRQQQQALAASASSVVIIISKRQQQVLLLVAFAPNF